MTEITSASAKTIAQAIRDGQVSAYEVVRAHLDRIAEVNPSLNAVVRLCAERALDEAREADAALSRGDDVGPLHGVPMTLKDSLDTEGVVSTGGTAGRRDFIPKRDATLVARLRKAGAILLGKTNTPEITWSGETDNDVYGRTNNPFDLERSPGGSSGGAAATVAACCSPFDIGSDTGGSIRAPAHLAGIAGIKPNSGRVPRTGHIVDYMMGAIDSYTQNGPMARYVEDLALILPVISGPDWIDPSIVDMPLGNADDVDLARLRVAFYTDSPGFIAPNQDTRDTVQAAVGSLSDAVASIEEDVPRPVSRVPELNDRTSEGDKGAGTRRLLDRIGATDITPRLIKWLDETQPISTAEFTKTLEDLDQYRSDMLQFMQDYDVIISPTTAQPAQQHGEYSKEDGYAIYTHPYNLTGWPATVVRCGTSADGLPIGVQVVARPWREDVSLAVAAFLESALGGWQKPPI
ncbi:MAG: amidase [Dehalococcoidia bacterium]|nr:amidase [Dehalococcoidia bacterium]